MPSSAARKPNQDRVRQLSAAGLAGLALGGLLIVSALAFLALQWLNPSDPEIARSAADESAGDMAAYVASIDAVLSDEDVVATARQVPETDPQQTAAVAAALAERGQTAVIDLRVYPPRAEEIEVGSYPEPDFTTVQMLIEARRRGVARARIRHAGTGDEHLALARAVNDAAEDVAAIILLRLPAEPLTGLLHSPESGAWLRLTQDGNLILSQPEDVTASTSLGRQIVDGTALTIEWGVPQAPGMLSAPQSLLMLLVGALVMILGGLLRFGPLGRMLAGSMPVHRPAAAPVAAATGDKTLPPRAPGSAPPHPASADQKAQAAPAEQPAQPDSSAPKPDLPDWLLDEGGADLPFGDDDKAGRKPGSEGAARDEDVESPAPEAEDSSPEPSDGGLELDVPDLDEILAQIEKAESSPSEPSVPEPHDQVAQDQVAQDQVAQDQVAQDQVAQDQVADEAPDTAPEIGDGLDFLVDTEWRDEAPAEQPTEPTGDARPADPGLDWEVEPDDVAGEPTPPDQAEDESEIEDTEPTLALDPDLDLDVGLGDEKGEEESLLSPFDEVGAVDDATAAESPSPEPVPAAATESAVEQPAEAPDEAMELLARLEGSDLFDPVLFKVDGIRGVVDRTLDARRLTELGRALGTLAREAGHATVVVGRDGRVSGAVLMSAVIRGLRNAGVDVIEAGALPAPVLWHAAVERAQGCGVMVSASHHGPVENGLQAMLGGNMLGREQWLQAAVLAVEGELAEGEGSYTQENVAPFYATALADSVKLKRPLKVVVDCGNGIAGTIVPILFEALEVDLIPLYCDVDGSFPNHLPDPTDPECLEDLRLCVRNFRADLGFAFDGDGDRLALVSDKSEVAGADQVLMLLAQALHEDMPDAGVVLDVRCAGRLRQFIEDGGAQVLPAPAGGVPVARGVVEHQAALGGAMDGQFVIAHRWHPFGDAICTAVRLLELLSADRRSVQECLDELPEMRTTGAMPISVEAEHGRRLIAALRTSVDFGDGEVTTVDGIRVDFPDRWGLVRYSPDDAVVELRLGAHDTAALTRIKTEFRDWLLSVDPDLPLPY
jgi:phosphomannomutase / phosphoglucomutase